MLKQHFKLFYRNVKRHKSTFIINMIGLTSGLSCVLFIFLWVKDEISIDNFHDNHRLVQIMQNQTTPNGIETEGLTQGPLAEALKSEFPEVDKTVAVVDYPWFEGEKFLLSNGEGQFFSSENQFAGKNYFSIFSFPLAHGRIDEVLSNPNGVVISEEMARKLYGNSNAIGKALEWVHDEYGGAYTITGVFKTLPQNSTVQFDAVFHLDVFLAENDDLTDWKNSDLKTFALLKPEVELGTFNQKLKNFLQTKDKNQDGTYFAQLFSEKYLHGNYAKGKPLGGRISYVRLFIIIALLILVIACVNFINLSTAKASTRTKEIGIKKVVGAAPKKLVFQFTIESIITSSIAMGIAILVVYTFLKELNTISGKQLGLEFDNTLILGILCITIGAGLIAGLYPAFYMSHLSALHGLKGKVSERHGEKRFRKGLVVFQFVISIVLIAAVSIVYKQMHFVFKKNLGYEKEHIVWFSSGVLESNLNEVHESNGLSEDQIEHFLQTLKNIPGVVNAANFRHTMMADFGTTTGLHWPKMQVGQEVQFGQISGGYDFIETMQIRLKEGRHFSRAFKTEKEKIIFNETAIKKMGMKEPIGKVVSLWGEDKEVIGVVKDFHIDNLYSQVMPVFMKLDNNNFASNIMVRLHPKNKTATIQRIKAAYKDYFITGMPFELHYLDDNHQSLYEAEKRVADLSKYFAGMAILISCLGLFGLAIFSAERRKKEISIRKVLGQSIRQVTVMLSTEFLKLVFVAILIALPVAYFLAEGWLAQFAYSIPLHPGYFIGAGVAAMAIALLTVGSQSIRAAHRNPVDALRNE